MSSNVVELYTWYDEIEDYVLSVRVKQKDGCRLLGSVKRRKKRKLGEKRPECPALNGELEDCSGCRWHKAEKQK